MHTQHHNSPHPSMATPTIPTPIMSATSSATATPTRIPRRRMAAAMAYSPPAEVDDEPGTPGPVKARINNLTGQVQELVRKQHTMERKHRAEMLVMERRLEEREQQMLNMKIELLETNKRSARAESELQRCKAEGEGMREELNLYSLVQQQKAILAMSEEKLQLLEMEQRLVQSEMARTIRDHKISLFQSREADLVADVEDKEWRIAELEKELASANTSLAHRRAAEDKAKALFSSTQGDARAEVASLEAKLADLEAELEEAQAVNLKQAEQAEKHKSVNDALAERDSEISELKDKLVQLVEQKRTLKAKNDDITTELEQLRESKGDESSSEVVAELRAQLRAAKTQASTEADAASDALAELELSKEREKALKVKFQQAQKEQIRLAGIEEELAAFKAAGTKTTRKKAVPVASDGESSPPPKRKPGRPKKTATASPAKEKPASKSRVRKTSPVDSDDESQAKPKAKRSKKDKSETPAPLSESAAANTDNTAEKPGSDDEAAPAPPGEKKKKRRLLAGQTPAFTWDPILNSGDGVIPTYLSPVRPNARSAATIPRAGFSSLSSRRF